jgi:amino acid adenylation domain-containing protein
LQLGSNYGGGKVFWGTKYDQRDLWFRHFMRAMSTVTAGAWNDTKDTLSSAESHAFPPPERGGIVERFSGAAAPAPDGTLVALFERQVRQTPDNVALVFEATQLTYRDLDQRANRLAWKLMGAGIGPEDRVAICLERSPDLIVAILATLKAGAAYVPLEPGYPTERLAFMLGDVRPGILITASNLRGRLPDSAGLARIELDSSAQIAALAALPVTAPGNSDRTTPLRPDHPAYLIYTSGSTGRPKGVVVTHFAAANSIWARTRFYEKAFEALFFSAPISFDISVAQIFWTLGCGARLIVARNLTLDLELAQLKGVTHLMLPAAVYSSLLSSIKGQDLPRLHCVVVGGDALPAHLIARHYEIFPEADLVNEYGTTETAVWSTASRCQPGANGDFQPIGAPIANTGAYVLDAALQPCPAGVVGELYIAGAGLARSYWNRPALTAERFVANPFASQPGARLYRTGDLATWREDGNLVFQGRADQQVKVRGFRIEPGEIEAALLRQPHVGQAAVVTRADPAGDQRLVAYLVPDRPGGGDQIDLRCVRQNLASDLPDYMIPGAYVLLDALPLTANGKVDRMALPAPEDTGLGAAYVAPATPEEVVLCELVAELLGVPRVGVADDFFLLGGHSLLAARLAARVRARLGRELPIRMIFETPILGDLARTLPGLEAPATAAPLRPDPGAAHEPFPLTPVQEAYWLGRQNLVELGEVTCHAYVEFQFGHLDLERLKAAWRAVIARHPMLRAIISPNGMQRVLAEVPPISIGWADFSHAPADQALAGALAVREEMSHQVLPSERWPIFEVRVTKVAETDWRLHLNIDALILDGESYNLLMREVFELYAHPAAPRAPAAVSFRDYVLHLRGQDTEAARAYWQARIDSLPPAPALPLAIDPARLSDPRFSRHQARLDPALWQRLKARAAAHGLTASNVLMTAYAEVLGTWASSSDFTLNLTVGDRRPFHPDISSMLGVFTNLTPLEIRGANRGSFRERARVQQRQLARDLDHRAITGADVQRLLAQRAGDPLAGLLPVVFTSVIGEAQFEPPAGATVVYSLTQTPQTWLDNMVGELDGGLGIDWDAPTALFPPGLLDAMFAAYVALLGQLADSEAAWDEAGRSLVPAAERDLLAAVNATAGPCPNDLLHEPIFAAAAARPQDIAVIGPDYAMSFGELDHRARAVAHQLKDMLRPDDLVVAIVMQKGVEQLVAALAVLEAGRIFLPISVSQPASRIRAILEQAGARVALVQTGSEREWAGGVKLLEVTHHVPAGNLPPRLAAQAAPEDPAYVIYTSGSTGVPKGVTIAHRAARNTLADLAERFHLGRGDRVLWVSALEFDLSIFDLFGLLGCGGSVVIPPPDGKKDPLGWAQAVQRHGVTVWNSVPALAELMLSAAGAQAASLLASLRLMMLSGDWIPVSLPGRLQQQLPACRIYSLGGATEASIWSIYRPIESVDPHWLSIPYGKPLRNQTFHVLKPDLSPCPIHTIGKLYIGGAGLAIGYWNDPGQTQARFITHPVSGERLYDTGDLGRYLPDGEIEFLGRDDHQVKLHGFRIELGEIEAALCRHPDVHSAVALLLPHAQSQRIVAYVVPEKRPEPNRRERHGSAADPPRPLDPATLRDWLVARVPDYMVPSAYVVLEALPLTGNGKLDRKALPAPEGAGSGPDKSDNAPYMTIHYQLIDLWQQLLGVPSVGIHDDFFALGGNSLLAMNMLYQIDHIFGQAPLASTLFKQPTIERLAEEMLNQEHLQPAVRVIRINDQGSKTPLFYLHGDFHGGGFYSMELSRHLGRDQPFYSLPPAELTDPGRPPTIQEMAAVQVQSIREVQPHGPYVIGGFCLGGLIAYEVAQQLAAAGEAVEQLLIIDVILNSPRLRWMRRAAEVLGRRRGLSPGRQLHLFCRWHFLLARLERWVHMKMGEKVAIAGRRLAGGWEYLRRRFEPANAPAPAAAPGLGESSARTQTDSDWFDPRWDVPLVYLWSAGAYVAKPYAGATTVLLSDDLFCGSRAKEMVKWKKYLETMEVRELPGSHLACITEHVDALAKTIVSCLATAPAQA